MRNRANFKYVHNEVHCTDMNCNMRYRATCGGMTKISLCKIKARNCFALPLEIVALDKNVYKMVIDV